MKYLLLTLSLAVAISQITAQGLKTYAHLGNSFDSKFIKTSDEGYLIASSEYCYTPGAIVIDGCVFDMHFIRTNSLGDTLWTYSFNYYSQYSPDFQLFENLDGSFSIFYSQNDTYECSGFSVGLFGFKNMHYLKLTAQGGLVLETPLNDECELTMSGVVRINNNEFLAATTFKNPIFINELPEGKFTRLNADGNILQENVHTGLDFKYGHFARAGSNLNYLAYEGQDFRLNIALVNDNGDILWTMNYDTLPFLFPLKKFDILKNGNLLVQSTTAASPIANQVEHFYRFDSQGTLLWQQQYWLQYSGGFLEHSSGLFCVPSTVVNSDIDHDAKLTWLSENGDSLNSIVYVSPEKETPVQLLEMENGKLVMMGDFNCCNLDSIIGPGQVFLLFYDGFTGTSEIKLTANKVTVYPNPVQDELTFLFENSVTEDGISIEIADIHGRKCLEQQYLDGKAKVSMEVDISKLLSGMYFYNIKRGGLLIQSGKLLKL